MLVPQAWGIGHLVDWPTIVIQCFDTVGWVIWPVKIVPNMTYNVFGGTLNPTLLVPQEEPSLVQFRRVKVHLANLHRWGLVKSSVCECGLQQSMHHIVNVCPLTKLKGSLQSL